MDPNKTTAKYVGYFLLLKEQCHAIFCFTFFMNHLPPSPENNIYHFEFFKNSYSQVKVQHWCHRHQQQIIGTISDCGHFKANLREKNLSMCWLYYPKVFQKKWNFFPFALWISPRIFEKIRNSPNDILKGSGETDSWQKPEVKISWHCPFNCSMVRTTRLIAR